jgi:hypothetical protein
LIIDFFVDAFTCLKELERIKITFKEYLLKLWMAGYILRFLKYSNIVYGGTSTTLGLTSTPYAADRP